MYNFTVPFFFSSKKAKFALAREKEGAHINNIRVSSV